MIQNPTPANTNSNNTTVTSNGTGFKDGYLAAVGYIRGLFDKASTDDVINSLTPRMPTDRELYEKDRIANEVSHQLKAVENNTKRKTA